MEFATLIDIEADPAAGTRGLQSSSVVVGGGPPPEGMTFAAAMAAYRAAPRPAAAPPARPALSELMAAAPGPPPGRRLTLSELASRDATPPPIASVGKGAYPLAGLQPGEDPEPPDEEELGEIAALLFEDDDDAPVQLGFNTYQVVE